MEANFFNLEFFRWIGSNFGAQVVAGFEELEEISASEPSRSGLGLRGVWDLDQVPWERWRLGKLLQPPFLDGFDLHLPLRSPGRFP